MTIFGLGGAGSVSKDDHRDRHQSRGDQRLRDRSYSSSRSRSRGRRQGGKDTREQLAQSAKAAVLAGAGEAFRSRKEPEGQKKRRVLTAAVSAGAINALLNSGAKEGQRGGKMKVAESVAGGLAVNYLVNGSRHQDRSRSRKPSRERRDHDAISSEGRDVPHQADAGLTTAAGSLQNSSSEYNSSGEQGKRGKSLGKIARAGMAKLRLGGRQEKEGRPYITL